MKEKTPSSTDEQLKALFGAIAGRQRAVVARLLEQAPGLASEAAGIGAARRGPAGYFFEAIMHYAYAGDTALHMAAAAYERDIAADLIARGANVRARNRRGAEPLHYAADGIPDSSHWDPEAQGAVIALLIKAGADPNGEDKSGVAPLHRAVRTRCSAAVSALLAGGTDVRRRNKSGSTPLHLAIQDTGRGGSGSAGARAEQTEIIRVLLRHGARPSDKNAAGKTVAACVTAEWISALLAEK